MIVTQCFGNGVKIMGAVEQSQGSTELTSTNTFTLKKSDALCYTRTLVSHIPLAAGGGITTDITTQDPSGTTVATVHVDENNVIDGDLPGRLADRAHAILRVFGPHRERART